MDNAGVLNAFVLQTKQQLIQTRLQHYFLIYSTIKYVTFSSFLQGEESQTPSISPIVKLVKRNVVE